MEPRRAGNFGIRETAHGIFYNSAGQLATALFSFLLVVLLTNTLSVQEYGVYIILFGITPFTGLLLYFAMPPILRYVPDFVGRGDTSAAKRFVRAFLLYGTAVGLVMMGLVLAFPTVFAVLFGSAAFSSQVAQIFAVVLFYYYATEVPTWALNALGHQRARNAATVTYSALTLVLAFLALQAGMGLFGVMLAIAASMTVYFILLAVSLKRRLVDLPPGGSAHIPKKQVFRYTAVSYVAHFGELFVMLAVDVILLGLLLGPEQTGLYGFATKIPTMLANYSPAVLASAVLFPFIVSQYARKKEKRILSAFFTSYTRFAVFFVAPLVLGAIVLGLPLIRFVFSEKYVATFPLFALAVAVMGIVSIRTVLQNITNTLERPEITIYSKVFFLFSAAAIILFAPALGILAAFSFTATAMLLMTATEFALTRRLVPLPVPKKSIAKSAICAAAMAALLLLLLPRIDGIAMLLAAALLGAIAYLALSYLAKPFEAPDRELFARAGTLGKIMSLFAK